MHRKKYVFLSAVVLRGASSKLLSSLFHRLLFFILGPFACRPALGATALEKHTPFF